MIALVLWLIGSMPTVPSWNLVWRALPLFVALQLADIYRQRFYLGRQQEWGLHWRAAVLQFANWPYIVLAVVEAIHGYRGPYVLTRKLGTSGRPWFLSITHGLVNLAVVIASLLGGLFGNHQLSIAHAAGALLVMASVAVIASSWLPFPPPYHPDLPRVS